MCRSFRCCGWSSWLALVAAGVVSCSFGSEPPSRNDTPKPLGNSARLSGAGAPDEADTASGIGDESAITNIDDGHGSGVPTGGASGGGPSGRGASGRGASEGGSSWGASSGEADSGGAFDESVGGIGGAASIGGGATGAGGRGSDAAGGFGGFGGPPALPSLLFSEYVEGSSSNKALEITAVLRSTLDECKVGTYFNGKTEATVVASLSGVLEAGRVLTLCTSTLKARLGAVCNQVGNLTFNGDDVIALSCAGRILDVIGQIGVDPGTAWGNGTSTTLDHTLRRKCAVSAGRTAGTSNFDPAKEWQSFPVDSFGGLGTRGC